MFDGVEVVVNRFTGCLAGDSGEGRGSGEGAGPLAFCVVAAAGRVLTKSNQTWGCGNGGAGVVECVSGAGHGKKDGVREGTAVHPLGRHRREQSRSSVG
jgi:hypothetical protein